jgi:hypothetical protein
MTRALTDGQVKEAAKLHKAGWTYKRLGEKFEVNYQTVKRALDPEFRAKRCKQVRDAARQRARANDGWVQRKREHASATSMKADGLARLAEIPPDTRSLTARMFGDPIPGDRRRNSESLDHG